MDSKIDKETLLRSDSDEKNDQQYITLNSNLTNRETVSELVIKEYVDVSIATFHEENECSCRDAGLIFYNLRLSDGEPISVSCEDHSVKIN